MKFNPKLLNQLKASSNGSSADFSLYYNSLVSVFPENVILPLKELYENAYSAIEQNILTLRARDAYLYLEEFSILSEETGVQVFSADEQSEFSNNLLGGSLYNAFCCLVRQEGVVGFICYYFEDGVLRLCSLLNGDLIELYEENGCVQISTNTCHLHKLISSKQCSDDSFLCSAECNRLVGGKYTINDFVSLAKGLLAGFLNKRDEPDPNERNEILLHKLELY